MGRPASTKGSVKAPLALHQLPGEVLTTGDVEGEHWYDCAPEWPPAGAGGVRGTLEEWREVAGFALASASRAYEKRVGAGEGAAARALAKEKTIGDKIAAITLLVQESPLHRLDELHTLLDFARKKGRRESAPAIEAMKDLFVNDLLPGNRRLIRFHEREFESAKQSISKRNIAYAVFEDELKVIYHEFLQVLEESGKDALAHFKQKAVKQISELLVAKPEHEQELLSMLVNKLGDPDRKVSSTASYNLMKLIEKHHPQMRLIVIREVEQLVTRPNVTMRTQYYAIGFLNQLRFTADDVELARKLLRIYMDLFTSCLARDRQPSKLAKEERGKLRKKKKRKRKREALTPNVTHKPDVSAELKESRLMGALLMGANRAYPFTKPEQDDSSYDKHYDSLFSVAHAHALGPATQALSFLFQVAQCQSVQSDRFYRALYSRLYDAAEAGEPKQAQFLNLLYRALDADVDPRRVKAFVKRLLQAALNGSPAFAGACAIVISECFKGRHRGILKSFISLSEQDDEEEKFFDADKNEVETAANVSRDKPEEASGTSGEIDDHEESVIESTPKLNGDVGRESTVRLAPALAIAPRYDITKRDPQYAKAERSSLWELVAMCSHFHPSVSLFANTMCVDLSNVQFRSDPLKDFSLISFLDKFVYKKPKNRVAKSLYGKRSAHCRTDPVANSEAFQALARTGDVGEDDRFFVKFFDTNPSRVVRDADNEAAEQEEREGADFAADSEEEAFEQAMKAEMQRLGADAGFASNGIKSHLDDVDEQDADELKAFEKAFEGEMVESDDQEDDTVLPPGVFEKSDGEGNDAVVPLQAFEGSDSGSSGSEEVEHPMKKRKKGHSTNAAKRSMFAAAEDYAEAIDREAAEGELEELHALEKMTKRSKEATRPEKKGNKIGKPPQRKRKRRAGVKSSR